MNIRTELHNYLSSLNKYLARLHHDDAAEVIKEIESHILDAVEAREANGETVDMKHILAGFGSARDLASQYVDHVLQGAPPPKGFKAIQSITRGVTKGLWYSMAFFGYFMAGALALVGLAKLLFPNQVGLWSAAQGQSVVITFTDARFPMSQEVLGWWLVPLALLASGLVFILTRKVLKALRHGMP
ncbi:HAAS signaling domain-containing protein [Marinicella meishanensis]|uniref:HAAS signaling domain-containing protein n=1 Tax=Marinicella meishanensis TaxID=2873263 RepID=UPI001CBC3C53|nr:hypothetical protein [Marinicella sp. NBU2979]